MTDIQEMKQLATTEAKRLKKHAHKTELANLDINEFNPEYPATCIYGQMTGYCFSERAHELMGLCAPKMYVLQGSKIDSVKLNGSPKKLDLEERRAVHYSPIETVIYDVHGGSEVAKKIIAFLKDETQTLEL